MLVRRLDGNHDMVFGNGFADFAADAESVAQRVKTRLLLLREEWFLDMNAGVPYLQEIATKPANIPLAEAIIKRTILETEGISTIRSFAMRYDRNIRKLNIQATVTTIYNDLSDIKVTL